MLFLCLPAIWVHLSCIAWGSYHNALWIDTAESDFGIRLLGWDATNGFQVNGENVKLKGGCIHHDHGILGACSARPRWFSSGWWSRFSACWWTAPLLWRWLLRSPSGGWYWHSKDTFYDFIARFLHGIIRTFKICSTGMDSPSSSFRDIWMGTSRSHSGDAVQTGISVRSGGPVWERYSGLIRLFLELPLFRFFTINLHFPQRPFWGAGYCSKKMKKAVLPKQKNGCESGTGSQRPFEKEKAGILMALLRHKNPGWFTYDNFLKTL